MYVQGVANFLDDFMGGLLLLSLALLIGSLVWAAFILRVGRGAPGGEAAIVRRCVDVLRYGALALVVFQSLKILTKGVVLASSLGELPLGAYAATLQFRAGIVRIALAALIWAVARGLSREPFDAARWRLASALALPLVIAGAWLVHGVGRFEERAFLMSLTVLHQLAAVVWVGCVTQLLMLWRLRRREVVVDAFWPVAVSRFALLGIVCVTLLVASGVALTLVYVGAWDGLLGTGYGSLVSAKVLLLTLALGFAFLNLRAGRSWVRDPAARAVTARVPYSIEAEAFLLVVILFVAASLASMPPAVDIRNLTATAPEVLAMFTPRMPGLESPTHAALLAGEAARTVVVGRVPSLAATQWSDYNHNVAGVFLVAMAGFALLSYVPGFRWAKFWPAGFVLLGIFLFFRSDAEAWPLGPLGFWVSMFGNAEILQHRLATMLALVLGLLEMRARTSASASPRLRYVFPVLCALGGILLVTHSHLPFEIKTDFLIQSTHLAMGLLAVVMAVGRWLELRLGDAGDAPIARVAGLVSVLAMLAIGAILSFYEEPLY
ncbi:MAG: CopD family protein [Burkholderiales bacterium]